MLARRAGRYHVVSAHAQAIVSIAAGNLEAASSWRKRLPLHYSPLGNVGWTMPCLVGPVERIIGSQLLRPGFKGRPASVARINAVVGNINLHALSDLTQIVLA